MGERVEDGTKRPKWGISDKISLVALAVAIASFAFSSPVVSLYHAVFGPFRPSAEITGLTVTGGIDREGRCNISVDATAVAHNIGSSDRMWLAAMTYSGMWYPISPVSPLDSDYWGSGTVITKDDNPIEVVIVSVPLDNQGQFSEDLKAGQGLSNIPPGSLILSTRQIADQMFNEGAGCDQARIPGVASPSPTGAGHGPGRG